MRISPSQRATLRRRTTRPAERSLVVERRPAHHPCHGRCPTSATPSHAASCAGATQHQPPAPQPLVLFGSVFGRRHTSPPVSAPAPARPARARSIDPPRQTRLLDVSKRGGTLAQMLHLSRPSRGAPAPRSRRRRGAARAAARRIVSASSSLSQASSASQRPSWLQQHLAATTQHALNPGGGLRRGHDGRKRQASQALQLASSSTRCQAAGGSSDHAPARGRPRGRSGRAARAATQRAGRRVAGISTPVWACSMLSTIERPRRRPARRRHPAGRSRCAQRDSSMTGSIRSASVPRTSP